VSEAIDTQHAMHMRRTILLSVASRAPTYFFPRYLTNGAIFGKNASYIKRVL